MKTYTVAVIKTVWLRGRRSPEQYVADVTVNARSQTAARRAIERAGYVLASEPERSKLGS